VDIHLPEIFHADVKIKSYISMNAIMSKL